jgi:hypothetical protein
MGIREIWNKLTIQERKELLIEYGFPNSSQLDEIIILNRDDFEIWLLEYSYESFPDNYEEFKKILLDDDSNSIA